MVKILVSDYDQTFYLNDEDIEINKEKIDEFRKNNNIFIFATGRSFLDFKDKVEEYNLKYDYALINHGATIIDNNDNIIYNKEIENMIISNIKNDLNLDNAISTFCCSKLDSRVKYNHPDLTKINVSYNTTLEAKEINNRINLKYSDYVKAYQISEVTIEMVSSKIDKSKAIEILSDYLKLNKDNIYTIGDGYSDINMVKTYSGYCMKDSVEDLKKVALKEYDSVSKLIDDII